MAWLQYLPTWQKGQTDFFKYGMSIQSRVGCQISSFIMDPECPLPEIREVQQTETDVAAFDDGLPTPHCAGLKASPLMCASLSISGHKYLHLNLS